VKSAGPRQRCRGTGALAFHAALLDFARNLVHVDARTLTLTMPVAEAVALLATESGLDASDEVVSEIATALGCEAPALRWAAALARTTGWRPLRQRLASWKLLPGLLRGSELPWRAHVESVQSALTEPDRALLLELAACDAPFTWDVLESVTPEASIESICRLEETGLLVRSVRTGVVAFCVPFCVRAVHRLAEPRAVEAHAARWLDAWVKRAEELRPSSYGPSARGTLAELAFAVPLAERGLLDDDRATQEQALALWTRVSDAMFFAFAIEFGSGAFLRAVEVADGGTDGEARVHARLVASRALLERGDPERAEALLGEALTLATTASRDDLRREALRGLGWSQLASARLDAAKVSFESAAHLLDAATDPRGHADAIAGLGILALLQGDPESARARLDDAVATHVLTRDAPRESAVRGMTMLLPERLDEAVDTSPLAKELEELRATGQTWRQALVLARLGLVARARGDGEGERTHLSLARAAAGLSKVSASALVATLVDARVAPASAIVIGFEARSLALPSGETHELTRHGPLRRMLWAIAVAHREKPGVAMTTLELVDAAWPGEKMKHEAATLRVYTTIRRLRSLGLADALLTRDDGYLFEPDTAIVLETA
jgi:tetratricopeptide (TPR) repeat protein